jgi:hypothetical protein
MNNIIETRLSAVVSNLVLADATVPFSLMINKTPEWSKISFIDVAKLLKIYTINFLMELETNNYPEGRINIYHSHNYFLVSPSYTESSNFSRYIPMSPRNIPSCEFTAFPHTPETLKERNIFLNCKDQSWCQFAYQFFHEYCHYMTRTITSNWFLEALCDLASLYFLRKLTKTWLTMSLTDHPVCKNYYVAFFQYAQREIDKAEMPSVSMAEWHENHKDILQKDCTNRNLNRVPAKYFLPYFEANPGIWNIVCFVPFEDISDFPLFMEKWHKNCPGNYKKHIQKFVIDLGI